MRRCFLLFAMFAVVMTSTGCTTTANGIAQQPVPFLQEAEFRGNVGDVEGLKTQVEIRFLTREEMHREYELGGTVLSPEQEELLQAGVGGGFLERVEPTADKDGRCIIVIMKPEDLNDAGVFYSAGHILFECFSQFIMTPREDDLGLGVDWDDLVSRMHKGEE